MNNQRYLIIDFYVDEPACLGVPPFISPYPRYIFGALVHAGVPESNIDYLTVDYIRKNNYVIKSESFEYTIAFVIGGAIVPGKYLGYEIGTVSEIENTIFKNKNLFFAIGGLVSHQLTFNQKNMILIKHDIEQYANSIARDFNNAKIKQSNPILQYELLASFAIKGAQVVKMQTEFPNLIAEIETYRGCPRQTHCSFCSESIKTKVEYRNLQDILDEVETLAKIGILRFRIGRQADILCYGSNLKQYINGFPKPNVTMVSKLFQGLKQLKEKYNFKTLNIDNVNPGTIINFPVESKEILKEISDTVTPGDTIPLGVESFDPKVISQNNLKGDKDSIIEAVRIINEVGGERVNNIPIILPGINLIHGLKGESSETFKINFNALKQIIDEGLLIKRINIRRLLPFPGTAMDAEKPKRNRQIENRYEYFKEKIRSEIDHEMLKKIYPLWTVLQEIRIETISGEFSYGKQLNSYPITCKFPEKLQNKVFLNAIIIGHRQRSLVTLSLPIKINHISSAAISLIPGIGKKASSEIIVQRPFNLLQDLIDACNEFPVELQDYISFDV